MSPHIRTLSHKTSPDFTDLWEQFVVQLIEPDGGHEQARNPQQKDPDLSGKKRTMGLSVVKIECRKAKKRQHEGLSQRTNEDQCQWLAH